jgi:hypothetical protein
MIDKDYGHRYTIRNFRKWNKKIKAKSKKLKATEIWHNFDGVECFQCLFNSPLTLEPPKKCNHIIYFWFCKK